MRYRAREPDQRRVDVAGRLRADHVPQRVVQTDIERSTRRHRDAARERERRVTIGRERHRYERRLVDVRERALTVEIVRQLEEVAVIAQRLGERRRHAVEFVLFVRGVRVTEALELVVDRGVVAGRIGDAAERSQAIGLGRTGRRRITRGDWLSGNQRTTGIAIKDARRAVEFLVAFATGIDDDLGFDLADVRTNEQRSRTDRGAEFAVPQCLVVVDRRTRVPLVAVDGLTDVRVVRNAADRRRGLAVFDGRRPERGAPGGALRVVPAVRTDIARRERCRRREVVAQFERVAALIKVAVCRTAAGNDGEARIAVGQRDAVRLAGERRVLTERARVDHVAQVTDRTRPEKYGRERAVVVDALRE